MKLIGSLTALQLRRAAAIKDQIDTLEIELGKILGEGGASKPAATGGKRTMSAAGRARIIAAQKARWAKVKGTKGAAVAKPAGKGRRKMSAAAKAKIAAAAKARWAKVKAAGKNSL